MMIRCAQVSATVLVLYAVGCGAAPQIDLTGEWRGSITEGGKRVEVGLSLQDEQGQVEGSFSILSDTGEDVDKGMTFDIVQVERSGNMLRFIVPITGEINDDAIAFELQVAPGSLQGHGRERREGSKDLPITFTRSD